MPEFNIAWHTHPGLSPEHDQLTLEGAPPTRLRLASDSRHEADLDIHLDTPTLTLTSLAVASVWHYFRLADATLKPLPGRPAPMTFLPGDTYIALSPGARRLTDSAAIARFLHLRDYFNAEKLAAALLAHLAEVAGTDAFPEDVTVLVIEAR